jgi:hypothetical protein
MEKKYIARIIIVLVMSSMIFSFPYKVKALDDVNANMAGSGNQTNRAESESVANGDELVQLANVTKQESVHVGETVSGQEKDKQIGQEDGLEEELSKLEMMNAQIGETSLDNTRQTLEEAEETDYLVETVDELELESGLAMSAAALSEMYPDPPSAPGNMETFFAPPVGQNIPGLQSNNVLVVTDGTGQEGAIWSKKKVNLLYDFEFEAYIYLGNEGTNAADGMTVTFHNDPRGNNIYSGGGKALGVYSVNTSTAAVANAISLEFDTDYSYGIDSFSQSGVTENNKYGHIAFMFPVNNMNTNNSKVKHYLPYLPSTPLSNGAWKKLNIKWTAETKEIGYKIIDYGTYSWITSNSMVIDPIATFGGMEVYWGFTGATGSRWETNALAITKIPQNIELLQEASISNNTKENDSLGRVVAEKGDVLTLSNHTTFGIIEGIDRSWQDSVVTVELSDGLEYVPGTVVVDDVEIPDADITIVGNKISFPQLTLNDLKQDSVVTLQAKVVTDVEGEILTSKFTGLGYDTYYEREAEVSSQDIDVLTIEPTIGIISIQYLDENNNKIQEDAVQSGSVGDSYNIEIPLIEGYLYDRIVGDAEGFFVPGNIDIIIYYKTGTIEFVSVPETLDFRNDKISNVTVVSWADAAGALSIRDARGNQKTEWKLTVRESTPLTSETANLSGCINYVNGAGKLPLGDYETMVKSHVPSLGEQDSLYTISDEWDSNTIGFQLRIPPEKQVIGTYSGVLNWTLTFGP